MHGQSWQVERKLEDMVDCSRQEENLGELNIVQLHLGLKCRWDKEEMSLER